MAVASKATVDGMALSSGHRIVADLSLDPTAEGGLRGPLPSGTPSLILEFHDQNGKTQLGARIETACGEPLRPGEKVLAARAVFWADEAVFMQPKVNGLICGTEGTLGKASFDRS